PMRFLLTPLAALLAVSPAFAQRPMQVADLFKVKRVADPQVSVSGDVAYQVGTVDLDKNKVNTRIWLKRSGAEAVELNLGDGSQSHPRFSPDGTKLCFEQGGQLWIEDLAGQGRRQLTAVPSGASGASWSPDGKWIAFTTAIVPSGQWDENAKYLSAKTGSKSSLRRYDTLMFRHWTEWFEPLQKQHLFVVRADGPAASSELPRDLTAGLTFDVPNFADVAAGDDYAWSPDSKALAFGANPQQNQATSTNGEIFEVELAGGPPKIISRNPAMDTTPRYSPDGKYLAWRAQVRPGFEADKFQLRILDRVAGTIVKTTQDMDLSIGAFAWKGSDLLFTTEEKGHVELFSWSPFGEAKARRISEGLHVDTLGVMPGGEKVLAQMSSTTTPMDVYAIDLKSGKATRVTHHNEALASELGLSAPESFWFKGGVGKDGQAPQVQGFIVKPAAFDPAKRYPVAFLVHGGPQGAWSDSWSHRWNPQLWAGAGFVVVEVNFRGSTGYGQKFTDAISGDWNGLVMKDIMKGLDAALKRVPNADPKRVVAAGASYGGYAVNWMAGHYPDRFAAFISHAGIYNTESMQLATEELWFPRWEFKGWPWENPQTKALWQRMSPHNAAMNFKKPMLVSHGELDYRVPFTEGIQLYQTLQLRQVPSEFLVWPDEGHWVLKPQNSQAWHTAVLGWAEKWTKPDAGK
ncbi:MAG: S9 family peptidase, partial [Acidobacteriota bacterium]|nr:S9 family peptidase [Acidobacteriota bacterium]